MNEEKTGAITERQNRLKEKLGIDTYARYPTELIEFLMDRPPADEVKRAEWHPIQSIKTRVYATYMRYSWCWPICLEYAVATDPYDGIRYDHMDRPMLLSQEAIAKLLDTHQQRVADAVEWFVERKRMRIDLPPGRTKGHAVFLTAKPHFTEEERQKFYRSTPVNHNSPTVVLPEKVQRLLSNLFNALGPNDAQFPIPPGTLLYASLFGADGSNGHSPKIARAEDLRTQVKQLANTVQLRYLEDFKKVAYSHRKGFSDLSREVRNLIDQSQRTETVIQSSSSIDTVAGPRASQPTDRSAPSPQSTYTEATTTIPKDARFFELTTRIFTNAGKGAPTPKQLGTAWKLIPTDAELEDWETFLLKVEKGSTTSRIARCPHAGLLATVAAEFATVWTGQRAERERQRFGVRPRVEHEDSREVQIRNLQGAIEAAQKIADNPDKLPSLREEQRKKVQELRDKIAALNGKADAATGD